MEDTWSNQLNSTKPVTKTEESQGLSDQQPQSLPNAIPSQEEQKVSPPGLIESNWKKKVDSFENLGLKEDLLRGIFGYGFKKPSPIQSIGILPVLEGHDTVAQAQSGTGKTGTFSISALQIIDEELMKPQVLIVAPTRELAAQIGDVATDLGHYLKMKLYVLIGGTDFKVDVATLKSGVHLVVGTPGKVYAMIKKGYFKTDFLKLFIMDEADELLNPDFKSQIQDIFRFLPKDVQIGLFSATMPPHVLEITEEFMRDPVRILVQKQVITLEGIKQYYVPIEEEQWKLDALMQLYMKMEINQCIIYVNSKKRADWLTQEMRAQNFVVAQLHGEMKQKERAMVMKEFRTGSARVLITTDLLSRGIDVQSVSLVINYELPRKQESYIHRIGRSGRYGKKGLAINFVMPSDIETIKHLQAHYATQIELLPVDLGGL